MPNKLILTVTDCHDETHDISYTLTDNRISVLWFKKILHLHRIPLSKCYTNKTKRKSVDEINASITQDLLQLKKLIGLDYTIKKSYDQHDCNILHDITISSQYDHSFEIREIFHSMHRNIHYLEDYFQQSTVDKIYVGWGENEGLLESKFNTSPYDLYQMCSPGTIALCWSEFGKTPYQYWRDKDSDNIDHFLKTCRPHKTFRAQFNLFLSHQSDQFSDQFYQWFDLWKERWKSAYGCDWTPIHERGGVPLAYPDRNFDWPSINTVSSIDIL